jgi:DNA-binding MarR family transcriptional regulator
VGLHNRHVPKRGGCDASTNLFKRFRQRMQRLADELAPEGLVKFVDNPKHRRSKLVQLTRKGDAHYRELNARFLMIAAKMGVALSEADIRKTTEIVRQLSDDMKARLERRS